MPSGRRLRERVRRNGGRIAYLLNIISLCLSTPGCYFDRLDTYHFRTSWIRVPLYEFPLPYVGKTPRGKILSTCPRKPLGDYVGLWEHSPFSANTP